MFCIYRQFLLFKLVVFVVVFFKNGKYFLNILSAIIPFNIKVVDTNRTILNIAKMDITVSSAEGKWVRRKTINGFKKTNDSITVKVAFTQTTSMKLRGRARGSVLDFLLLCSRLITNISRIWITNIIYNPHNRSCGNSRSYYPFPNNRR